MGAGDHPGPFWLAEPVGVTPEADGDWGFDGLIPERISEGVGNCKGSRPLTVFTVLSTTVLVSIPGIVGSSGTLIGGTSTGNGKELTVWVTGWTAGFRSTGGSVGKLTGGS